MFSYNRHNRSVATQPCRFWSLPPFSSPRARKRPRRRIRRMVLTAYSNGAGGESLLERQLRRGTHGDPALQAATVDRRQREGDQPVRRVHGHAATHGSEESRATPL